VLHNYDSERRKEPRGIPQKPAYINFGARNGGIVSDISVGGLGFQAVAPVPKSGIIVFGLSLEGNHRVEAVGEVVWRDATNKRGGLRFTSPLKEVLETQEASQSSQRTIASEPAAINLGALTIAVRTCPTCGNKNVHRSRRRGFWEEYLLRFLHICPYHCDACYRRFYGWG
jgi:PilZ domain